MLGYVAGLALLVGVALFPRPSDCPPQFEIGQTYAQIAAGPCPDIARQAFMKPDPEHTVYYCPSKNVAVVGSIRTGKMVGFFLWEGPPPEAGK